MAYCQKCGKHVAERMYQHLQRCQGPPARSCGATDDTASPMATSSTWSNSDYSSGNSPDTSSTPEPFSGGGGTSDGGGASGDW